MCSYSRGVKGEKAAEAMSDSYAHNKRSHKVGKFSMKSTRGQKKKEVKINKKKDASGSWPCCQAMAKAKGKEAHKMRAI